MAAGSGASNGPIPGRVNHAAPQVHVGFYSVFLPPSYDDRPDEFYPVCFLLHGASSTEEEIARGVLPAVPRERLIYVAPRAPHTAADDAKRFRIWPASFNEWKAEGFPRRDIQAMRIPHVFTDWLARVLADVRARYRTDNERVVVMGHGEGATYAHVFAYHHPELVRAYFAYGGGPYDLPPDREALVRILKKHTILPFIAHCKKDPVSPVAHAQDLEASFEKLELEHRMLFLDLPTHDLQRPVLDAFVGFLDEHLGVR